jgi:tRNA (adenine57-N1/adenine58-N1)-methyltransferase
MNTPDTDPKTRADERPIESGETLLFIDEKGREYLRELRPGRRLSFRTGHIDVDPIVGRHDGLKLRTSMGGTVFVFRPTYDRLIPNLPRKAQVIYPKDSGAILTQTDIYPGARVIESGVGPGALTLALLRAIGREGTLISIERREDHIAMARENIAAFHGEAPNWTTILGSAEEEIGKHRADRIILDLPDPAPVIPAAAAALRPGGMLACWVPTTLQLESLGQALRAEARFVEPRTSEILQRFWHVASNSIRPDHRMVAHTGFLTTAWRLSDEVAREATEAVEKATLPV